MWRRFKRRLPARTNDTVLSLAWGADIMQDKGRSSVS